jgi:hypothetical protein
MDGENAYNKHLKKVQNSSHPKQWVAQANSVHRFSITVFSEIEGVLILPSTFPDFLSECHRI